MTVSLVFLIQAIVVLALPALVLRFSRLNGLVPLVVVQIIVGIALGPSLFGRLAPDYFQLFFNQAALIPLNGIGWVAVLMFGLVTGLHVDPQVFRGRGRAFSAVATANIVVPTVFGAFGGFWILWLHPDELLSGISPLEFAVAIGICAGMVALPVLGAILREMDLLGKPIGQLALGIAGVNDTVLWILLGVLLTVTAGRERSGALGILVTVMAAPAYLVLMLRVVRPLLDRMITVRLSEGEVRERALTLIATVTIASALVTELIGLHYIIGAFVTGFVIPDRLRKPILGPLQVMTGALLMPFFFMLTGLRTVIEPGSPTLLDVFGITTIVAVIGIIGGTAVVARWVGEPWRFALGLGALLQTKGLMELIVLTVLLDSAIISTNVFAALILMALVSTTLAMPLARLLLARDRGREIGPSPLTEPLD